MHVDFATLTYVKFAVILIKNQFYAVLMKHLHY